MKFNQKLMLGASLIGGYYFGIAKPHWDEVEANDKKAVSVMTAMIQNVTEVESVRDFNQYVGIPSGVQATEEEINDATEWRDETNISSFKVKVTPAQAEELKNAVNDASGPMAYVNMVEHTQTVKPGNERNNDTLELRIGFDHFATQLRRASNYSDESLKLDQNLLDVAKQKKAKISLHDKRNTL